MTELAQIVALLKAIDARLARVERALCDTRGYVGEPPAATMQRRNAQIQALLDMGVIPIKGEVR